MAKVNRLLRIERLREQLASINARMAKLAEQTKQVEAEIAAEIEYAESVLRSAKPEK